MTSHQSEHSHHTAEGLLCPTGEALYEQALAGDAMTAARVMQEAACLVWRGLMVADPSDADRLVAIDPRAAAAMLLAPVELAIDRVAQHEAELAALFGPLVALEAGPERESITFIQGREEIGRALDVDAARCTADDEILTMQDSVARDSAELLETLRRSLEPLRAQASMRTLYPHDVREDEKVMGLQESIRGYRVEVRTVAKTIDRMIVMGPAAYIPASPDRSSAYRITDPVLVAFLRHEFDVLWQAGIPLGDPARQLSTRRGFSPDQRRAIALYVGGAESDSEVAAKLGVSVTTVRGYITAAKRSLGAKTRTQLGALVRDSDLLEPNSSTHGA